MSIINLNLPFQVEYENGQRCETLRDYVFMDQLVIRELSIVSPSSGKTYLRKLLLSCSPSFVTQIFDHKRESSRDPDLCIEFYKDGIWLHDIVEGGRAMLSVQLEMYVHPENAISFGITKIVTFGHSQKSPLDVCLHYFDVETKAVAEDPVNPVNIAFDHERGILTLEPLDILCMLLLDPDIEHRAGHIRCRFANDSFVFQYDSEIPTPAPIKYPEPRPIQTVRFFAPPTRRSISVQNAPRPPQKIKVTEIDPKCPAIKRIHRYVEQGEKLTPEAVQHALKDAATKLEPGLQQCLIYMIHTWAPELDDTLKLEVLCSATGDFESPYSMRVLMDNYREKKSYSMLLTLLQRQISQNVLAPKRRIPLEIEYSHILAESVNMPALAVRRLDAIKSIVMKYASPSERVEYALAYHGAMHTGRALQYLRDWMNLTQNPDEITAYGLHLARLMYENHEPIQSVIDVCTRVLEVSPQNVDTLEILAHCLESSNRNEEAAVAWQQCFELFIHTWEMAKIKVGFSPTPENQAWLEACHAKAIQAANAIELLIAGPEHSTMRCLVYRAHLRLEPDSVRVLAMLLESLESERAFYEMAAACIEFLKKNADTIDPSHEISVRLTLHNIYDCELNRPEEAEAQLCRAREIAALDPRVIATEIDRCRRRGLKEEQVGLRLSLIESLPNTEIAEPTLELLRLYEELGTPDSQCIELLRKTNARLPNQPQILLELRAYLRKTDQLFELSTVLEKLSRVINDLQARKAILIELSEVNDKLGNKQVAQAFYHEAQLCGPINPENDDTAIPGIDPKSIGTAVSNPNLASILLTSRSLSLVSEIEDISMDFPLHKEESENTEDHRDLNEFSRGGLTIPPVLSSSRLPALFRNTDVSSDEDPISGEMPLESQITVARAKGNTDALLERLLASIKDLPDKEKPPRVLQEIGCIYLYDRKDLDKAREYLELATILSEEVEYGEQTLNALEKIYSTQQLYPELAMIYEKKIEILTVAEEKRRYEVLLAQLQYEKLGATELAISTLEEIVDKYPNNELALQQLAQIYINIQDPFRAIETLERITKLLPPNSKEMAQHTLRLISLYSDINYTFKAKQLMHGLLKNNTHIDKLAVIELFKRTCREHDEWQELLYILCDELAYYLHIPPDEFELKMLLDPRNSEIAAGYASHALREYADVLYYKLKTIEQAAAIYATLIRVHPEDAYPKNALFEMAEQYPDNPVVMARILDLADPAGASLANIQPPLKPMEKHDAEVLYDELKKIPILIKGKKYEAADAVLGKQETNVTKFRPKFYTPILVAFRHYVRTLRDKEKSSPHA